MFVADQEIQYILIYDMQYLYAADTILYTVCY